MVYHPQVKAGKTFWIGSSEMWRLRMYKEQYLERFWMKLCRFMGSSNMSRGNSRITIYMSRRFPEKSVGHIDVQVMDRSLAPMAPTARPPVVTILPPDEKDNDKLKQEIKLQAHPVTEGVNGWFGRDFAVGPRGQNYHIKVTVPDDKDLAAETTFDAYPSNPELDNTAPDIKALFYDIASPSRDVLVSADKEARAEYEQRHRMPGVQKVVDVKKDDADKGDEHKNVGGDRLYFDLSNADLIPKLLIHNEKSQINKGEAKDLIYDEHLQRRLETWSIIITAALGAWMALVFMMQLLRDSSELTTLWYLWRALALLPVVVLGFLLYGMLLLFGVFSAGEVLWLTAIGGVALGCGVVVILQLILNDCKSVSPLWFVWRSLALLVAMGVGFGLWELGTRVPNGAWLSGWLPGAEASTIVAWFSVIAAVLVWWSLLTLIQITLKEGNDVPPLWFLWRALGHLAVLAVGFCLWALGTVITAQGISMALNVPLTAALIIGALVPIGLLVWFGLQALRDWRDLTPRWFLVRGAAVAGAVVVGLAIFGIGKWFESAGRFPGLSSWPVLMKPEDSLIPVVMMVVVTLLCFEWLSRKLLRLA
jgi:hypothetical protein